MSAIVGGDARRLRRLPRRAKARATRARSWTRSKPRGSAAPARSRCSATSFITSSRTRSSRRRRSRAFLETARRLEAGGRAGDLRRGQPRLLPARLLRRERVRVGRRRGSLRGGRAAVPRDARRPAQRAGPAVPFLEVPVEERRFPRGARLRSEDPWPTASSARSRRGCTRTNFKHKTRLPVEMIRGFAGKRFRGGVDVAAARPLPRLVDRRLRGAAASRSCRPSWTSESGWRSPTTGRPRSFPSESGVSDFLALPPVRSLSGVVRVPPSKSATNRALLLAALTEVPVEVVRPLASDDTRPCGAASRRWARRRARPRRACGCPDRCGERRTA